MTAEDSTSNPQIRKTGKARTSRVTRNTEQIFYFLKQVCIWSLLCAWHVQTVSRGEGLPEKMHFNSSAFRLYELWPRGMHFSHKIYVQLISDRIKLCKWPVWLEFFFFSYLVFFLLNTMISHRLDPSFCDA